MTNQWAVLEATLSDAKSRWDHGAAPDASRVLREHPELSDRKSLVLELAYDEFCRRNEFGEDIDVESFCQRFPACRASLRRRIEVDQFLDGDLDWLDESDWPQAGQTFGRFQLVRQVGQGAASRVYLAQQTDLGNRLVVLKLSLYGFTEAKVLSRLEHPNIMPIYSVEENDSSGLVAICMPYLTPWTLLDFLDVAYRDGEVPNRFDEVLQQLDADSFGEPPSGEELPAPAWLQRASFVDGVLHVMTQVADALRHTHERGILHLDLKPTNILITRSGRPLLLDFNLSADAAVETTFGGTPPYMSPEQLQMLSGQDENGSGGGASTSKGRVRIDARSDIFSLGVVLYELLAGRHPFGRIEQRQASRRVAHELLLRQEQAPPPLVQATAAVCNSVSDLVRRCMAVDPSARPASAQRFGAELKKNLVAPRRISRWSKGHPKSVAAMLASLLIMFGSLAYVQAMRPPKYLRLSEQGLELMERGAPKEAVEVLSLATDNRKDLAELWFARGRARQQAGDPRAAIDDYNLAIKLNPDGKYFACKGYCRAKLDKYEEAIVTLEDAERYGFQSAELYVTLGRCYLERSKFAEAMDRFSRVIDEFEGSKLQPLAHYGRVKVESKWSVKDRYFDSERALEDVKCARNHYGERFVNVCLDAARVSYSIEQQAPPRLFDKTFSHLTSAAEAGCAEIQLKSWRSRDYIRDDQRLQGLLQALLQHPRLGTAAGPSEPEFLLDPLGARSVGEVRRSLVSGH